LWDEEYPEYLRKIYDPPPFLFVRGKIEQNDRFAIAIVGTRVPSPYGRLAAERFAHELCDKGIAIVSGLARGIDTIAHSSCLKAGGRTLAVIGSGVDVVYPPENQNLAEQIEMRGAIVSEFYMGTPPDAGNFPRRNRIVSGMTLGTLIVESPENGGAMITASTALDQNRELFCIPGNITEKNSIGTNILIRDGRAKLVLSVDDILAELGSALRPILKKAPTQPSVQLSVFELRILELLSSEPLHIDTLSEKSGLSIPDTLVNLLGLEFKGMVRQLAGKMFLKL
jgi:DNA processing protein